LPTPSRRCWRDLFHQKPILLILDDLERILAKPEPGQEITPVADAPGVPGTWRTSLGAVLRAFAAADTDSRLLLTSRFDFALPDGSGRDLAAAIERVQLRPMETGDRAKQWRAAERNAGRAAAITPEPGFLLLAANCAERIGRTDVQIELLEKGLALPSKDKVAMARIAVTHATATINRDGPEKALRTLQEAANLFDDAKDVRSRAVTMGKIADILAQRGETDEALRILTEECLPAARPTGDIDVIAYICFSCARYRLKRGGRKRSRAKQTHFGEFGNW